MSQLIIDQQLIEQCLFAFNSIRNTKITPGVYTYDLASALDKAIQENKSLGFIAWSTDDVLSVRPNLTQTQAEEVLYRAIQAHDSNVGINWEALESVADALF